jgi:hypothetical protein
MEEKKRRYDNDKFWVAEEIGFFGWPKPEQPIANTGDKKIAAVYQTWSTEAYLPYMYHSLLSQILYTDILDKADIYIYVEEHFHEYTVHQFSGLIDPSAIIKVPKWNAVKYQVTSDERLKDYEIVVVSDSDMFYFTEQPSKLYQKIEDYYRFGNGILLVKDDGKQADETFWSRHLYLNNGIPKKGQYLNFFDKQLGLTPEFLKDWLDNNNWYVSPFFAYRPKDFVNEEYKQYAQACADNSFYCDETVWIMWALANKIDIVGVQDAIDLVDVVLEFPGDTFMEFRGSRMISNSLSLVHPLAIPNQVNPTCVELINHIKKEYRKKAKGDNLLELTVSRSWRAFGKQQFVAICELVDKIGFKYDLDFHININEIEGEDNFDQDLVDRATSYARINGHSLTIYRDEFYKEYARSKNLSEDIIVKFGEWQWIYHLLMYHKLYFQNRVKYLLTYDDDILFNDKPIGELEHLLTYQIPFACADQFADSDKCMMGKLCVHFGAYINDEYYANTSCLQATNSGFMGLDNTMFEKFTNNDQFAEMVKMFEFRKWDHKTMTGEGYDSYKILLQEQSFLGILNRAFSNRTHRVLDEKDGYIISSDLEQIRKSKIEHYVSVAKYTDEYVNKLNARYEKYFEITSEYC